MSERGSRKRSNRQDRHHRHHRDTDESPPIDESAPRAGGSRPKRSRTDVAAAQPPVDLPSDFSDHGSDRSADAGPRPSTALSEDATRVRPRRTRTLMTAHQLTVLYALLEQVRLLLF